MYNVIIFSKDRAAQLDLLMRSIARFAPLFFGENLNIITKYSNDRFRDGYFAMPARNYLVGEKPDFKQQVIEHVKTENEYTVFFTDDDVFIREWNGLTDNIDWNGLLCVSLCLHPNIDYSYTNDKRLIKPMFFNGTYWNWMGADTEWNYPMRVCGHIYKTADLLPLLKKIDFPNPNMLEANMACHPIDKPKVFCYPTQKCINIAANMVQNIFKNRAMHQDSAVLNEKFLEGQRIDMEPIVRGTYTAPHNEVVYKWSA